MGASLSFHGDGKQPATYLTSSFHGDVTQPATYLTQFYTKFSFYFDQAYEITEKYPNEVYKLVPESLISAYHWINIGVNDHTNSLIRLFSGSLKSV